MIEQLIGFFCCVHEVDKVYCEENVRFISYYLLTTFCQFPAFFSYFSRKFVASFVKNDETKLEAMKILRTFYNQWKIASLDICIEEEVEIAEEPLEIGSGSCELLDPDPFKSVIEKEIRSTIDDELDYYISLQPEECKNPLIYWNTNQTIKVLKFLPEMAKFFISMPPTADHRIDLNLTRENLPPGFTNIKYLAILNMLRGDAAFYSDKLNSKPDVNDEN